MEEGNFVRLHGNAGKGKEVEVERHSRTSYVRGPSGTLDRSVDLMGSSRKKGISITHRYCCVAVPIGGDGIAG